MSKDQLTIIPSPEIYYPYPLRGPVVTAEILPGIYVEVAEERLPGMVFWDAAKPGTERTIKTVSKPGVWSAFTFIESPNLDPSVWYLSTRKDLSAAIEEAYLKVLLGVTCDGIVGQKVSEEP